MLGLVHTLAAHLALRLQERTELFDVSDQLRHLLFVAKKKRKTKITSSLELVAAVDIE